MEIPKRILICILVMLVSSVITEAQNWKKTYGTNSNFETGIATIELSNDTYLVLCRSDQSGNPADGFEADHSFLMHLDAWGNVLDRDTLEGHFVRKMKTLSNGDFLLFGMKTDEEFKRPFLSRYDPNADNLWTQYYRDTLDYGNAFFECAVNHDFTELQDGSLLFHTAYNLGGTSITEDYFFKTSAAGEVIWQRQFQLYPYYGQWDLETLADGNVLISKDYSEDEIIKIDTAGTELWSNDYGALSPIKDIVPTPDGGAVFIETIDGTAYRIDGDGNLVNEFAGFVFPTYPNKLIALEDGSFLYTGYAWETGPPNINGLDFFMRRVFPTGSSTLESKKYFTALDQIALDIIQTSDGGFLMTGYTQSPSGGDNIHLIKVDSTGEFGNHNLSGNILNDVNMNCLRDTLEPNLGGFYIIAEGTDTTYATSDSLGNYTMNLDLGNYDIRIVAPNDYWSFCTDSVSLDLTELYGSTILNFEAQALYNCPFLEVDISTPLLRRCFPNTYHVSYCNTGTEDATDVSIEVMLDDYMIVDSASIPFTSLLDSLYVFDIGTVASGTCNTFQIYFTLDPDCDSTMLGETHCVEAHIYPDEFCSIDPSWSGANVALSADCGSDTLSFFIENTGTGNMDGPLDYVIIEDEVILLQGVFDLDVDEVKLIEVPANGSTYRLEAEQEPGHPAGEEVSLTVEGCGVNASGGISTGYVNLYPDNDGNPFAEIDCQENIGAYDPNDKQGFPLGYSTAHYIDQNEELEYMVRFQNTGTDTAFNIVILDTLSGFLDPLTVRPGVSSHPYRFALQGNGVLKFSFENIMLPDSNVNEVASNGFVKFRIDQVRDNPIGSEILNSAAIYFDFNDPVITNTTLHTIGEDYVIVSDEEVFVPTVNVLVYPNPFGEEVTFELEGAAFSNLNLELYNSIGELLRVERFENNKLSFYKNNLNVGVYFYTIKNGNQIISSGSLILQ